MRILYIAFLLNLLFICLVHAGENRQAENLWTLSFQDDFERTELGGDWTSNDALISNGRMLVGSNRPASAKITKAFPSDVKIEFDAEAFEGKPPCDLSVTLAAERLSAMSWNYLLAFGHHCKFRPACRPKRCSWSRSGCCTDCKSRRRRTSRRSDCTSFY